MRFVARQDRCKSGKEKLILVKVPKDLADKIGATSPSDFCEKLSSFIDVSKKLESAMADVPTLEALEKRVAALEKPATPVITEARVKEIITADAAAAVTTFANSDAGKKVIGAEASRIASEALASVGTQPAKPSPAPADPTPGAEVKKLEAEGKFEEVYALDKDAQKDFTDAKSYASFRRAQNKGQIRIANN